jgi:peptidoglycan/xylan/chitin deacetylase (PgdA/CDA1 family)
VKAISLVYHDAVKGNNFDESGLLIQGSSIYKLDVYEMQQHFEAIAASKNNKTSNIYDFFDNKTYKRTPLFLTFDDGGISAASYIAPLLDKFDWVGHFFITSGYIGKTTFVNSNQIKLLKEKGHVVGTHSWSHPVRMSKCNWHELENEWRKSITKLSDIIGDQVTTASVPGGYFSKDIAKTASACGIRALFTSEPIKNAYYIDNCLVLGRYGLLRGMSPSVSASLASDDISLCQMKQYLLWNMKKVAKLIGGNYYLAIRERIQKSREGA